MLWRYYIMKLVKIERYYECRYCNKRHKTNRLCLKIWKLLIPIPFTKYKTEIN